MNKNLLLLIFSFLSLTAFAQVSYFPAGTENIRHTPSAPANNMMSLVEQRGLIKYEGRSCDDSSLAFVVSEDGSKSYGNNRWVDVHLQVQHYKPDAKMIFDQVLKLNHPSAELNRKQQGYLQQISANEITGSVSTMNVAEGKMLVVTEENTCVMTKYKNFKSIFFTSYAIVGTTIIWIDAAYNRGDSDLAITIHNEIIENIKKTGVN